MKTKIFIAVFGLFAALVSCKKAEKGDMGPTGPAGSNGTNSNVNVKVIYFGKDSITTTRTLFNFNLSDPSVTSNMLDSSAVLVYHQTLGLWYSMPGLGYLAHYQSRFYTANLTKDLYISVYDPDGTTYTGPQINVSKFKVVIIPSADYKGYRKKPVDFDDYKATMKYYGLPLD
jgi:hypothetical protein